MWKLLPAVALAKAGMFLCAYVVRKKFSSVQNPEECDATDDEQNYKSLVHKKKNTTLLKELCFVKYHKPKFPTRGRGLQIPQWVSAGCQNVALYVEPESQHHIDNDGWAQRKKRNVHKPHAYAGGGDAHSFANGCAYTKSRVLNEVFHSVHTPNIEVFSHTQCRTW